MKQKTTPILYIQTDKHADESLKIKTKHPIQGVRVNYHNKKIERGGKNDEIKRKQLQRSTNNRKGK